MTLIAAPAATMANKSFMCRAAEAWIITVEMPPGPIISGMAKGTMATAPIFGRGCTVISSCSCVPILGLAGLLPLFIIDTAIRNTKMPPPTWKEPVLMLKIFNIQFPLKMNTVMMMKTDNAVIWAVRRRSLDV